MSRRSTLKRRRERKRREHEDQRKQALELPPKVSTAKIFEALERQAHMLSEILAESESQQ